jgi:hypothetical protein
MTGGKYNHYFLMQAWGDFTFFTHTPSKKWRLACQSDYPTSMIMGNQRIDYYIKFGQIINFCIDFNGQMSVGIPIPQIIENLKLKYKVEDTLLQE